MTIRKDVSDALVRQGYRRRGRAHIKRVDDDISRCVDVGPRLTLAPYVGFRSERVERLLTELMAVEDDGWTATFGANVGYVLDKDYQTWPGGNAQNALAQIDAGFERLAPFVPLESMAEAFDLRGIHESPSRPYTLVVLALLAGDAPLVRRRLEEAREIMCARDDEVCEQFRGFEQRVRARLATGGGRPTI